MKRLFLFAFASMILITNTNLIKSQNTGPVAPEAMSFEPVDATDMVNLVTGDMSYVLPLITVPGPEGGYPLALSYHAGITMDQEASWVGLGWTINPGAINREVAGYPDDWNNKKVFNITRVEDAGTFTRNFVSLYAPLSVLNPALPSIGLNASWGTHWSFGGSVGYGISSTMQAGIGFSFGDESAGISFTGGQKNGVSGSLSLSTNGIGLNAGFDINNKDNVGLSASINNGNVSFGIQATVGFWALGVDFSTEGINVNSNVGISYTSLTIATPNDFGKKTKSWDVNLGLISFGHYKASYWLYKESSNHIFGTIYSKNVIKQKDNSYWGDQDTEYNSDCHIIDYDILTSIDNDDKRDIKNNLMFASYDNYSVAAQGLGGSIAPRLYEPGMLFGNGRKISQQENDDRTETDEELRFCYNIYNLNPLFSKAEDLIYFNFLGENNSYLKINPVSFEYNSSAGSTAITGGEPDFNVNKNSEDFSFYNETTKRKGNGKYVEWFTNSQLSTSEDTERNKLYARGFIETESLAPDEDRTTFPNPRDNKTFFDPDGIGAFSITTEDGKTYHYSLPVYQYEEILRQYQPNKQDFYEYRKLEKYAYTWLLTAITGPDFMDRGGENGQPNGLIDDQDYGYWVKFEYGKWSDGFVWQRPYVNSDKNFPYYFGRKQVYYLNSIQTRTHTAYFVKNRRDDGKGALVQTSVFNTGSAGLLAKQTQKQIIRYGTVYECSDENCTGTPRVDYVNGDWLNYQNQKIYVDINHSHEDLSLKLDKIIIVKNSDQKYHTNTGENNLIPSFSAAGQLAGNFSFDRQFEHQIKYGDVDDCWRKEPKYSISFKIAYQNNILDINDIPEGYENSALKIVNFNYDYSLCKNTPNSEAPDKGKLTLISIEPLEKGGVKVLPPYVFEYNIPQNNTFDLERKDLWGFDAGSIQNKSDKISKPTATNWSLKNILTPIGTSISINYEQDTYLKEAIYNGRIEYCVPISSVVTDKNNGLFRVVLPPSKSIANMDIGDNILFKMNYSISDYGTVFKMPDNSLIYMNIYSKGSNNDLIIKMGDFKGYPTLLNSVDVKEIVFIDKMLTTNFGGGIRVKDVSILDASGIKVTTTGYDYSHPSSGYTSGITTYAPHERKYYIPFETELLGPMVMYEWVKATSKDTKGNVTGSTLYNFEVPVTPEGTINSNTIYIGDQVQVENLQNETHDVSNGKMNFRSAVVKNNNASCGRLISISNYNQHGHELQKTVYIYKTINEMDEAKQGLDQETFLYNKRFTNWGDGHSSWYDEWSVNSSSRIYYPSVLKSVITQTPLGKATTVYNDYDFYTGEASDITVLKANGDQVNTTSVPAFQIPVYEGMGSKVYNVENKNMLSQKAESSIKKWMGTTWKTISNSIQTWNNKWSYRDFSQNEYKDPEPISDVWRKHKTFVWKGEVNPDGSYKDFDTKQFDWTKTNLDDNSTNGWQKTSEITRYNHYSMPLESVDINGNYAATKMGYNNSYVIATASNANYNSFAYTGFESVESNNDWGGEFLGTSGFSKVKGTDAKPAHTGEYYGSITGTSGPVFSVNVGNNGLIANRTYRAMVWMHKDNPKSAKLVIESKNGSTPVKSESKSLESAENKAFGDWILVTQTLDKAYVQPGYTLSTYVYIENASSVIPVLIDDQRLQPIDAGVTAYAYDDAGNVTAIIDNNNFAAKFKYDAAGRLISSFKETPNGFKKVSENRYNYKRSTYPVGFTVTGNPSYGVPLTFTAFDAGTNVASDYQWNFGNGTTAQGKSIVTTFSGYDDGEEEVTLTVKAADGKTETAVKKIQMKDNSTIYISHPYTNQVFQGTGFEIDINWSGYQGPVDIKVLHNGEITSIGYGETGGNAKWAIPSSTGLYVITIESSSLEDSKSAQVSFYVE